MDGALLDTPELCLRVLYRVEIERRLLDVEQSWTGRPEPWGRAETRIGRLEDDLAVLDLLVDLAQRHQVVAAAVAVSPELTRLDWLRPEITDVVRDVLAADAAVRETAPLRRHIAERVKPCVPGPPSSATCPPPSAPPPTRSPPPTRTATPGRTTRSPTSGTPSTPGSSLDRSRWSSPPVTPRAGRHDRGERKTTPVSDRRLRDLRPASALVPLDAPARQTDQPSGRRRRRDTLSEADGEVRLSLSRLAEAQFLGRLPAPHHRRAGPHPPGLSAAQHPAHRQGDRRARPPLSRARARRTSATPRKPSRPGSCRCRQVVASVPMDPAASPTS